MLAVFMLPLGSTTPNGLGAGAEPDRARLRVTPLNDSLLEESRAVGGSR